MGILSIEQTSDLFWLGRYVERVFTSCRQFMTAFDTMLDADKQVYHQFCRRIGVPDCYDTEEEFVTGYLFDEQNPNSLLSNCRRAYDNAVVLRELISTDVYSYIQMSVDTLERAGNTENREEVVLMLVLQKVIDHLYAFWGAVENIIMEERARNILRVGRSIERLDLYIRLDTDPGLVRKEFEIFMNRLYKLNISFDRKQLNFLMNMIIERGHFRDRKEELIATLAGIFPTL